MYSITDNSTCTNAVLGAQPLSCFQDAQPMGEEHHAQLVLYCRGVLVSKHIVITYLHARFVRCQQGGAVDAMLHKGGSVLPHADVAEP